MATHMREHHTSNHKSAEVHLQGSKACPAAARSTGKTRHEPAELCNTRKGKNQSEAGIKGKTRKGNGGGRSRSRREEMVKLVADKQTKDQKKRAMWEKEGKWPAKVNLPSDSEEESQPGYSGGNRFPGV